MNLKSVNDRYHTNSRVQKRVVTFKNFTYRILISIIDNYITRNMTIVDLGCGVGTLDFYLASKGIRVVGIDASEIAIRAAKVNAKALNLSSKTKFIKQDLNKKISGKYDAALLTEVIEHLENEEEVLRLSNKLLKKGGLLIISTRASSAPLYKFNLAKLHDKRVGHIRRYTINKLNELVLAAGFKVVEKGKAEGLLRDFLFSFPKIGSQIVRMANKFGAVSDSLMFVDNICVKMFGESQIYLVAKK